MQKVLISIKQSDIATAKDNFVRFGVLTNPIALAALRRFKCSKAFIEAEHLVLYRGDLGEEEHFLPAKARAWLEKFLAGEPVEPFSFYIDTFV